MDESSLVATIWSTAFIYVVWRVLSVKKAENGVKYDKSDDGHVTLSNKLEKKERKKERKSKLFVGFYMYLPKPTIIS